MCKFKYLKKRSVRRNSESVLFPVALELKVVGGEEGPNMTNPGKMVAGGLTLLSTSVLGA